MKVKNRLLGKTQLNGYKEGKTISELLYSLRKPVNGVKKCNSAYRGRIEENPGQEMYLSAFTTNSMEQSAVFPRPVPEFCFWGL